MKILFSDFSLPYLLRDADHPVGGWAIQLLQLLVALRKAGHQVGVLTWRGANAYVGSQNVCELLETYDPRKGIPKLRYVYRFLPALLSAARAWRPDVVVQSCAGLETASMAFIAKAIGVPFVHRIANDQDTDGRYQRELDLADRIGFRWGLRRARFVICQNAYQLERMKELLPQTPLGKLHNCIAVAEYDVNLPQRTDRTYVAWLANFGRRKNLPLLVEVAGQLPQVEFRVAGGMRDNSPAASDQEVLAALTELKRLDNVTFLGYLRRGQVADFLSHAILLLCTSDYEGFSNAFLESFAVGTPVVLRARVDPDGIVAANGLGLVAPDESQLAQMLSEIVSLDAVQYSAMSTKCRGYVETHHSPGETVDRLVSMLEAVV